MRVCMCGHWCGVSKCCCVVCGAWVWRCGVCVCVGHWVWMSKCMCGALGVDE